MKTRKLNKKVVIVKWFAIFITALILGVIAIFLSNEWNRAAFGSEGYIVEGEKFGLSIGASKEEITDYLVHRGLVNGTQWGANETGYNPQRCHSHIYPDKYEVQIWVDESWRGGVICVAYLDSKLARVSWIFDMLAP